MRFLKIIFTICVLNFGGNCFAQTDSTTKKSFHLIPKEHSPKVAGIASAIVPGLGQAYNKKFWKVPIVFASGATAGYFIYRNYTIYNNFKQAYILANDTNLANNIQQFTVWNPVKKETYYPELYDQPRKADIQDIFRKYLDYSMVAGIAVYGLNILDAVVDAHLYNFNVNDDLSLNIHPTLFNLNSSKTISGFTLQLKF